MDSSDRTRDGAALDAVVKAAIGWLGLAACLAMVFLAMRAVMDVGGSCAEGGPYVVAQSCPEGSTPALLLGIFGGFAFAFLASIGGFAVGGFWAATPVLAWSALFGLLGWNFLEYGVIMPPGGSIEPGWAICGVLFWIMAGVPLLGVLPMARSVPGPAGAAARVLPGPGQRRAPAAPRTTTSGPVVMPDGSTVTVTSAVYTADDLPPELRDRLGGVADGLDGLRADDTPEGRAALASIAADLGAAIGAAMAETPADPALRAPMAGGPDGGGRPDGGALAAEEPDFTEGTQALLDRLERLADMRDRGLLGPEEYETAKAAVMAELEGRT